MSENKLTIVSFEQFLEMDLTNIITREVCNEKDEGIKGTLLSARKEM